uniref:Dipeptide epimerase n=1 Tax=Schlesneria paludicola TaxID=360056 RepID=A0A7C4LN38_9PLAN
MRLAELTAFHVRIPLRGEIRHASHARTETDSLIVRCRLNDGSIGWGEGLPRHYVTGETIEQAWELFETVDLDRRLGGSFDGLAEGIALLQPWELPYSPSDDRRCFGNSLRCAVELSILDAMCRAEGVPLSAVTRMVPETIAVRQSVPRVRYSGAFTAHSAWKQWRRAVQLRLFGFHQAKVKVGVEGVDDAMVLRRLRRVLGSTFDLRIDVNEAWTCARLPERWERLRPFGISAVEQPVPHAEVAGLAALRPRLGVPVILDESVCSEADARRAIEGGWCDLFNLRLSKCGGFLPALHLAALAHQAGLGYQLGCQVGETGILSAAGRHFASSVANIRYLEGSYDRFLVRERLTVDDLTFGFGGYAPALTGPGLGVTVDLAAVARVTVRQHTRAFN